MTIKISLNDRLYAKYGEFTFENAGFLLTIYLICLAAAVGTFGIIKYAYYGVYPESLIVPIFFLFSVVVDFFLCCAGWESVKDYEIISKPAGMKMLINKNYVFTDDDFSFIESKQGQGFDDSVYRKNLVFINSLRR